MKTFLIVLLAAAATAESDPWGYHYGVGYPWGYRVAAVGVPAVGTYANDRVRPEQYGSKGGYVAIAPGAVHVAKREAEADADAEPFYPYAYGYGFGHHYPLVHYPVAVSVQTYSNDRDSDVEYAGKGEYRAENFGALHVAKREAEADPHHLVYPYAWHYPVVHRIGTYANDAVRPEQYGSKGNYVAVSAGAVHVAKREAEADPGHLVFGGYHGLHYPGLVNYPVVVQVQTYSNDRDSEEEYAGKGEYRAETLGSLHVA